MCVLCAVAHRNRFSFVWGGHLRTFQVNFTQNGDAVNLRRKSGKKSLEHAPFTSGVSPGHIRFPHVLLHDTSNDDGFSGISPER